jgi:hypothetical protein
MVPKVCTGSTKMQSPAYRKQLPSSFLEFHMLHIHIQLPVSTQYTTQDTGDTQDTRTGHDTQNWKSRMLHE